MDNKTLTDINSPMPAKQAKDAIKSVPSSFSGDWWLYVNDGSGQFTFDQELPATIAASCALMVDLDNDGDLDLALIDELEDEVILLQNNGVGAKAVELVTM